jgi:tetratricopeptide (TPR) repeat protein
VAEADPGNTQAQRDWSVSLERLGDLAEAEGDLSAARHAYQQSLDILKRQALADPRNTEVQRDWSVSLNKVGDMAKAEGDLATTRQAYQQALDIRQTLAEADQRNAQAQRDLWVSFAKMAELLEAEKAPNTTEAWRKVHDQLVAMKERGILPPDAEKHFDAVRQKAGGQTSAQ